MWFKNKQLMRLIGYWSVGHQHKSGVSGQLLHAKATPFWSLHSWKLTSSYCNRYKNSQAVSSLLPVDSQPLSVAVATALLAVRPARGLAWQQKQRCFAEAFQLSPSEPANPDKGGAWIGLIDWLDPLSDSPSLLPEQPRGNFSRANTRSWKLLRWCKKTQKKTEDAEEQAALKSRSFFSACHCDQLANW